MAKTVWLNRRVAASGPYLTLCLSPEEHAAAMRYLKIKEPGPWMGSDHADASTHVCTNPDGHLACIVCLKDPGARSGVELAGILVHEAVHVWQNYAEHIGEDKPGVEQEAYAIQAISQELMQAYADRIVGSKIKPKKRSSTR